MTLNRRDFLLSSLAGAVALGSTPLQGRRVLAQAAEAPAPKILRVVSRTIEVNRKPAKVYGLQQADGTSGLTFDAGELFNVELRNELTEPTIIHWHGLAAPWSSDGVGDLPLPLLEAGGSRRFSFPVGTAGTHWMHAHTLQEQNLLAAPLIVRQRDAGRDEQEVVVLLHDFSFTPAAELLARLKGTGAGSAGMGAHGSMQHGAMQGMPMEGMEGMGSMGDMPGMQHGAMNHGAMQHGGHGMAMDLNDIEYDAYLANDRTLEDPEVVRVEKGGRVRLRLINGPAATGFWIDLGRVPGTVVAVDGKEVEPVQASLVPLSMGQRVDIVVDIPGDGVVPVLALREGGRERTGILLAAPGASVRKLAAKGDSVADGLGLNFERKLRARNAEPLGEPARSFTVDLAGTMMGYAWDMNPDRPLQVREGETVAITMRNRSMMSHPMHLHGHHFRVLELDGRSLNGALRDTLLIPPMGSAKIAFQAANPGKWAFHCHHLYHMASGMMETIAYENVG